MTDKQKSHRSFIIRTLHKCKQQLYSSHSQINKDKEEFIGSLSIIQDKVKGNHKANLASQCILIPETSRAREGSKLAEFTSAHLMLPEDMGIQRAGDVKVSGKAGRSQDQKRGQKTPL